MKLNFVNSFIIQIDFFLNDCQFINLSIRLVLNYENIKDVFGHNYENNCSIFRILNIDKLWVSI
jgi:hypothetical protein